MGLVLGACGQERAPAPPFHPVPLGDPWYESAPLVSVWTLPEEDMNRFGLDVNGVWTWWSGSDLTSLHEQGHRAMISMEVINMDRAEYPKLIPGLSKDICGSESEVSWLQDKVTMSIQSPLIQKFLLDSTARAIRVGVDAIFIDEIQTSAVEISLDRFGAGFGPDELNAFNQNLTTLGYPSFADYVAQIRGSTFTSTELQDLFALADPAGVTPTVFFKACSNTCGKSVSQASACTPAFYSLRKQVFKAYKAFQEDSGFAIMTDLVAQMRAMIRDSGKAVAIGANLVGLGAQTGWSPMAAPFWTKDLDFLVCEHGVNAFPDGWDTFLLPPAGSFAPLYKLGRALVPGFVSAFPGGALAEYWQSLPRTQTLIELMFSEAFAAEGNWSISYWNEEKGWPTDFLAPAGLAQYTRFVAENRGFYTGPRDRNPVAIVYTNQGVLADPDRNESYVGLAQALDRLHVQYDVLYGGDDRFWAAPIDESLLAKYHVVFLPNANALTTEQIGVFTRRATSGAATIALAPIDPGLSAA
ncbi:MAG TPA: hypothetical protein VGJ84_05995, partial [Polyangiaceae bacterium]